MTTILLNAVQIVDANSPYHMQRKDILIKDGHIAAIGENLPDNSQARRIDASRLSISVGWFDLGASVPDPGFEHRETIASACQAAAYGGFTEVAVFPNTQPVLQNKESLAFVKQRSAHETVQLYPIAALSVDTKGEEMTEMFDLCQAGALAFSDGLHPVSNSALIVKSLIYMQQFGGVLINHPDDKGLSKWGSMHEGVTSTLLGLKGMPAVAEELGVQRDLRLLEYAGGRLHFARVSAAGAVELIRQAKARGLAVTCDVAAHQLAFTDKDLMGFDTLLKVNPPLRDQTDLEALRRGLADGTIDAIVSAHQPQDEESKKQEFDLAEFGIIGLETAFAVANTCSELPLETLIEKISAGPRRVLNLQQPRIQEGEPANLTLFDPLLEWTFDTKDIRSKSKNTPFTGQKFKGKAVAVFNKNQFKELH